MRRWLLLLLLLPGVSWAEDALPKCLFVSSYHPGYRWSDGVEQGLRETLKGQCQLKVIYLDAKRKRRPCQVARAARKAKQEIDRWNPDVLIVSDDAAVRHLVEPFYKNADTPVVFCGVNWTVQEYDLPYANTTGMVEVAPLPALIAEAKALAPGAQRIFYLGADTATERKNAAQAMKAAQAAGLRFSEHFAPTAAEWRLRFSEAGEHDILMLGSNAGIEGWDAEVMRKWVDWQTKRLSITVHDWMQPYAAITLSKVPEEQGIWAGKAALRILAGTPPRQIPIATNKRYHYQRNEVLLKRLDLRVSNDPTTLPVTRARTTTPATTAL